MKKGISNFFGYEYDYNQIYKDIKNAGFDCIMSSSDKNFFYQTGNMKFQAKAMKELSLLPDSLHSTYKTDDLPYFFKSGLKGYKMLCSLKRDVKIAQKYGYKFLVVHLEGELSTIGVNRVEKLVEFGEKHNVIIAIENLIANRNILAYLFEHIKSDYLRFCFDAGHENCFAGQMGVLEQFADKLVCLHLHSNDGASDMHTLNKYGTVNWNRIARVLASLKNCDDIVLNYELIMRYRTKKDTAQSVLKECFAQACELEEMIKKYKQN